ncbi:AI-2E family transporter [Micromonospora endolithica]|uniref:AI-2E family transporter n=1 Tax=Micromonospora endolithica TaxID=230091 RepID=A0A3A9YZ61_9ACTN|nr:AI-2E family transporter [Micromonospora endolithica]RKN41039.1 AI-2E family transporter [Micromonospora endolithica]TWJ24259.1 putative PurR-regulated permease PerM [Micromonospora endolithica]
MAGTSSPVPEPGATWVDVARRRARSRLAPGWQPPAFTGGPPTGGTTEPVPAEERTPAVDDGLPSGVRTAGAWAWRIILFVAAAYLLVRVVELLRVVVIPVAVALLLAALFEPLAAALRRRGVNRSLAAVLVLVTGLTVVFGGLTLIVRTFISQLDDLSIQVGEGVDQVQRWLAQGPLHLSQTQLDNAVDRLQASITDNQAALTSGALSTAATLGELAAGFFLVLFTLFFYLRDGGQIWAFICRLLPRPARVPAARAGHYSWHTLVSYVRATVLVALVDAVGIGIGLAVLGVPLALPLAALVFLGAFIPVVGATVTGVVAVLVALVTQGPLSALIILGVVIAVQQVEGHLLQPLIMGRAVALHPLAVILAIATGVVVAGIVGGLVAVPLLAVLNTAVRYLVHHPGGEPTPDRTPPGTTSTDDERAQDERAAEQTGRHADPAAPPPAASSVEPADEAPARSADQQLLTSVRGTPS